MGSTKFVHLSFKSAYSLAEGAIHIKDIAAWAKAEGMPAIAITDTNNLFGALEFSETLKGAGVQPIIGCALSLKTPYFKSTRQTSGDKIYPVHLIAQNRAGFKNLLKIVSSAHLDASGGDDPHQDLDDLEGKTEGLILMTGGAEGPLGALIKDGRTAEAEALLETLKGLFPGRLYIEIQRHGMDIEKKTEEGFLELAYGMDLPLVATNNAVSLR